MEERPAADLDLEAEIRSLRRVVEAYVDYPSAAEAVIRRWEQSYSWLPPEHKALLPQLPAKYAHARRCIHWNAFFISNMLQAFDPPFPLPPSAPGMAPPPESSLPEGVTSVGPHEAEGEAEAGARVTAGRAGSADPNSLLGLDAGAPDHSAALGLAGGRDPREVGDLGERANPGSVEGGAYVEAHPSQEGQQSFAGQALGEGNGGRAQEEHALFVHGPPWLDIDRQRGVPLADADKVRCMLRSIVREWSEEGTPERRQAFDPILRELWRKFQHRLPASRGPPRSGDGVGTGEPESGIPVEKREHDPPPPLPLAEGAPRPVAEGAPGPVAAPPRSRQREPPRCLVPGAGLGRLPLEICRLGFSCQGNEFSFYTLICSNFLLNCCSHARQWSLFPWLLSSSNNFSDEAQLRAVWVPDQLPTLDWEAPAGDPRAQAGPGEGPHGDQTPPDAPVDFSMCAGDFVEVYRHPSQAGAWDCVATCFFLDTAHNVVEYLDIIHSILAPGGVWVNLGPLLYHHADGPSAPLGASPEERRRAEMSLELSLDDVRRVALQKGFRLERECFLQTTYSADLQSMMSTQYNCVMWTMVKA